MSAKSATAAAIELPRNRVTALRYGTQLELNPDVQDLGFSAKLWAQVSIPYLEPPAGTTVWERRNGDLVLKMQPALVDDPVTGATNVPKFPYGVAPRHALTWMATEAKRTRSRELEIGRNVSEFLRKIGMTQSGPNSKRIPDQLNRIFGSQVTVTGSGREGNSTWTGGERYPILDRVSLWTKDDGEFDDSGRWSSTVKLSEPFFKSIMESAVPVDLNVLRHIRNSPMQIDIYIWATHKASFTDRPIPIKWETLAVQFGSNFTRTRAFREKFLKHLETISLMYPELNYEATRAHLIMKPSRTSIPSLMNRPLRSVRARNVETRVS
jgi:hypothetical protein